MHGFLLTRLAERYSGARDFAMSTDDIAICGIAIAKPNPEGLKEFLIRLPRRLARVRCVPMADKIRQRNEMTRCAKSRHDCQHEKPLRALCVQINYANPCFDSSHQLSRYGPLQS